MRIFIVSIPLHDVSSSAASDFLTNLEANFKDNYVKLWDNTYFVYSRKTTASIMSTVGIGKDGTEGMVARLDYYKGAAGGDVVEWINQRTEA